MKDRSVHLISWGGRDIDISVDDDGDVNFVIDGGSHQDFILHPIDLVGALKELGVV